MMSQSEKTKFSTYGDRSFMHSQTYKRPESDIEMFVQVILLFYQMKILRFLNEENQTLLLIHMLIGTVKRTKGV